MRAQGRAEIKYKHILSWPFLQCKVLGLSEVLRIYSSGFVDPGPERYGTFMVERIRIRK
jgi:hypothetical protein